MQSHQQSVGPLVGKTFSLDAGLATSDGYYADIAALADECLLAYPDIEGWLTILRLQSGSKRRLRALVQRGDGSTPLGLALVAGAGRLGRYTPDVDDHLRSLSILDRFDRRLAMSREQYHLGMLEIELTNRASKPAFDASATRLAFLPHCLRDLTRECGARPKDADYVCAACSDFCPINAVSRLLRQYRVKPYIWMRADLKKLFRELLAKPGGLGVLGVACIPELVAGMRLCAKLGVPVVGVPLDANRCGRWMKQFHPTMVNLEKLQALLI